MSVTPETIDPDDEEPSEAPFDPKKSEEDDLTSDEETDEDQE